MAKLIQMQQSQSSYTLPDSKRSARRKLYWRLIGVVALVLYAVLLITIFQFLLRNILVTILFCLTAGVAAYAGWLVFAGKGQRRSLGLGLLIISGIALVAELIYMVLAISSAWALAAFILLAGTYALLAEQLRNRYWLESRAAAEKSAVIANFKKPYLIINPKSGNGRAVKAHIEKLAKAQGVKVIMLRKGDDVENAARRAAKAGADVLGISGGDGSIGAVVKVALERKLPVVVLPGGTRCHFARDIGLDPEHIADALVGFRGVERRIDVGDINGRIFLNNASFGLYADIVDHPGYRENKLNTTRDVLQSLTSGEKPPYDLQFSHASHHYNKAVQVLVSVNRYQTADLLEPGRREELDKGILQVTVLPKLDDSMIRRLLRSAGATIVAHKGSLPGIEQWDSRVFRITDTLGNLVVGVDGEREEYSAPVVCKVRPKALSIYVPPEGIRHKQRHMLSWAVRGKNTELKTA